MRRFLIYVVSVFLVTAGSLGARAGVEPYQNQLKGRIKKGDSLIVKDEKFRNATFDWNDMTTRSVTNYISLQLTYDTPVVLNKAFSFEVDMKVEYYAAPDQAAPVSMNSVKLKINFSPDTGATYKTKDLFSFSNGYWVKITINNITSPELGDQVPPVLQLTSQVVIDRKYNPHPENKLQLFGIFSGAKNNSGNATTQTLARTANTPDQYHLLLSWNTISGAEEYDLEWTTLDNGTEQQSILSKLVNHQPTSDYELGLLFRNNATRVTTAGHEYDISMVYNAQYLVARARKVYYNNDNIRIEEDWQYQLFTGQYAFWDISAYWHEQNLNWQYAATFAEEAKKKEVVSYFDGTLRSRQMVTINNSDKVAVVQETVYDEFGRAAANILPAPKAEEDFHFYRNFNQNNANTIPYDRRSLYTGTGVNCEAIPGTLGAGSGAAQYYSPNNSFASLNPQDAKYRPYHKYIPDAQGYPIAVTQYVNDNTGRIRTQGGVGTVFQPGVTGRHVTKYYYGKPESWELDRLFGNDVGYAQHYMKNMVVDPNGQISISYLNASGKTIATALTGPAPAQVDALPSQPAVKTETFTILRPQQFVYDASAMSLSARTTYLASIAGATATFNYDIQKLIYTYAGTDFQLCSNCYYTLTIKVLNDCGQEKYHSATPLNIGSLQSDCNAGVLHTDNFSLTFDEIGEYYISFELRIDKHALDSYTESYIAQRLANRSLRSELDFVMDYLNAADFTGCFDDCKTCEVALGTLAQFKKAILDKLEQEGVQYAGQQAGLDSLITAKYNALKANCLAVKANCGESPCARYEKAMLNDVSPGGQYALFATQPFALLEPAVNVLSKYREVFPPKNSSQPEYQASIIIKEDGTRTSPYALSFTQEDLVKYWQEEWAVKFLPFHPEKCKLDFCNANSNYIQWDNYVKDFINKATDIPSIPNAPVNLGYSYTNGAWLLAADAFFQPGATGAAYYNDMLSDLDQFSSRIMNMSAGQVKNVSQVIDYLLYCADPAGTTNATNTPADNWTNCTPQATCRVPDQEWNQYKDIYFELKQKYYQLASGESCAGQCPVGNPQLENRNCPGVADFYLERIADATGTQTATQKIRLAYAKGTVNRNTTVELYYPQEYASLNLPASFQFAIGESEKLFTIPATVLAATLKVKQVTCSGTSGLVLDCPFGTAGELHIPEGGYQLAVNKFQVQPGISYTLYPGTADQQPANQVTCPNGSVFNPQFYNCYKVYLPGVTVPVQFYNVWVMPCEGASLAGSNSTNSVILSDRCAPLISFYWQKSMNCFDVEENNGTIFIVNTPQNQVLCEGQYASVSLYVVDNQGFEHYMASCEIGPGQFTNSVCVPKNMVDLGFTYFACGSIAGSCNPDIPPSSCSDIYLTKTPRFPQVNYNYNQGNIANLPQENEVLLTQTIKTNCEAQADNWLAQLEDCLSAYPNVNKAALKAQLIAVCIKGGDLEHVMGASTSRPGNTEPGFNSFREVLQQALGTSALTMACNPWVMDEPHPYTPKQQATAQILTQSTAAICTRLQQLQTQHTAENPGITFYNYLVQKYGNAMNLTQAQLTKLQKSCNNCRFILEEEIPLPVFLEPNTVGCITGAEYNTAKQDLQNALGGNYDVNDPHYEQVLTNFMNHRWGFSMAYFRYQDYETLLQGKPDAILCNQTPYTSVEPDNYICLKTLAGNAIMNGRRDFDIYIAEEKRKFRLNYIATCSQAKSNARVTTVQQVYHYTLYYYDQAGNLVRTIPPEGVYPLSNEEVDRVQDFRDAMPTPCSGELFPSTQNKTTAFTGLSTALQNNTARAMEMWLYSESTSTAQQVRIITPDNKYLYQAAIANNKLWIELYTLAPGTDGSLEVTLSNQFTADITGIALKKWSHLVVQAGNLGSDAWSVYFNGQAVALLPDATAPGYPFEWEINSGFTLPAEEITALKHMRLYDRLVTAAEVADNFANCCQEPVEALAVQSSPLLLWAGLNMSALCTNTTGVKEVNNRGALQVTANFNSNDKILSGITNTFTVELWVNPQQPHETDAQSQQGTDGTTNQRYAIHPANGGTAASGKAGMGISVGTNGVSVYEQADAYMPALLVWQGAINGWTHVAVVYNNRTPSLYINGTLVKTGLTSGKTLISPGYNIGGGAYGFMPGGIDEVRIWSVARTQQQISTNYQKGLLPASAPGLAAYWPLSEEDGNELVDISCNAWPFTVGNTSSYRWLYTGAQLKEVVPTAYAGRAIYPAHALPTSYAYNSTGQVVQQQSPDGGRSYFWYDPLSRLIASQNEEQRSPYNNINTNRYSYTRYEPVLGRIIEVGEKSNGNVLPPAGFLQQAAIGNFLGSGTNAQITQTVYDKVPAAGSGIQTGLLQGNLRKRVSATFFKETAAGPVTQASYYSYDLTGNVKTLWQQVEGLGLKKLDYEYDLVSGKVNLVRYQHGQNDRFYYAYQYDAENRLTEAWSATELVPGTSELANGQQDAFYQYYLHGPLARMELGKDKVQGIDYAYTLQGWLKGINGHQLNATGEAGGDGQNAASTIARDVLAYSLGYYPGDYAPVGGTGAPAFSMPYTPQGTDGTGRGLYNGNISHTTVALSKLNNGAPTGYTYRYDQLNRLKEMRYHPLTVGTTGWNSSSMAADNAYKESITYDGNGNILTYLRNGSGAVTPPATGGPVAMDQLTYNYNKVYNLQTNRTELQNNKLRQVQDAVADGNYSAAANGTDDIDNQTNADNYQYDKIGNLVKDVKESLDKIDWTVYGKIRQITKVNGTTIAYTYDAAGNRVKKTVTESGVVTTTWYARDAQGNTMAVYSDKQEGQAGTWWKEQHLYGSSRLGMWNPAINIAGANGTATWSVVGKKTYELVNHLGNVLATITDKKIGVPSAGNSSLIDHYEAEVTSANDYYPFGMLMPGRKWSSSSYRYGFNGKENDNEVKGEGNQQDYGMRIYSPALGRFLSVDPLSGKYPFYTPYQFAGNSPILSLDVDGLEGDKNKNKTETSITIKIPSNNTSAQQLGSSERTIDVIMMGSLYTPTWFKRKVDRDIAAGALQPKLSISDADLTKFTATVIGESGHGMSFQQKLYIASVYYNLIQNSQKTTMGEKVEEGLTNSYAYHSRVFKDGHAYLGKPTSAVVAAMVGLGDASYANEPIPIGGGKTMTVAAYNATPAGQAKVQDAQMFKAALQKTIFSNYSGNPLVSGFLNQGYYADLNKANDKYTNWADARAYYHLQEQGLVTDVYVVQLTVGKYTTFLFDQKAIGEYFKNNPGMKPVDNPKLNPSQFNQ